jgi:lipoate---protein ligase
MPIFRRCSGGGCVLQNAGCLNYALVLPLTFDPALESVSQTNCFIMQRNRDAVASVIGKSVVIQGYTDLTLDGKKFSGNSQRRKARWVLFHGTFLLGCDFALMARVLRTPVRQPEYRKHRAHSEFLTRLECSRAELKSALRRAWKANEAFENLPVEAIESLVQQKYSRHDWNFRR